jgi:hypothetical protein
MWKNALIGLAVALLLTAGLAIIIYVSVARGRIAPTPTPTPTPRPTLTSLPARTATPLASQTAAPQPTVVGVVKEYEPGALIIVIIPQPGSTVEQIIVPENTLVVYADGRNASPREIGPGATIAAQGTLDALGRMVASRVTIQSAPRFTATSTPPPSPTVERPSATPNVPAQMWQGVYYNNATLSGVPVLTRLDQAIDFNWQLGSPATQVNADRFSVRWQGRWRFESAGYRFYAVSDDGVRVWVDGALVLDQWNDQPATLIQAEAEMRAGDHLIKVEYYDAEGDAQVRVWWEPKDLYTEWRGEYFPNPTLAGKPVLTRNDANLQFDWGDGSPDAQLPADGFSARWTRRMTFDEGAYRVLATADDGIRVWVDDLAVIDEWHDSQQTTYAGYRWLKAGLHNVRVEYFEGQGQARVRVWWEKLTAFNGWRGEYFANAELMPPFLAVRDDEAINFDWGTGAPLVGMPPDNFTVRWSRVLELPAGRYRFWAVADDGVRYYVDGALLINQWRDTARQRLEAELTLAAGRHTVVVEYLERSNRASIQAGWETVAPATPTLALTATPTVPAPTATLTSVPPTATSTGVPPTATPTGMPPTATATGLSPTVTLTSMPPTATATGVPPTATSTLVPPTATPTNAAPTATRVSIALTTTPTSPPSPSATPTGVSPSATPTGVSPSATPTGVSPSATPTGVSPSATRRG